LGGSPTCCVVASQANPAGTGWVSTNPDGSGKGLADLKITFNVSINAPQMALNSTTTQLGVFIYSADGGGTIVKGSETVTDATSNGQIGSLAFGVDQTSTPTTSSAFSQPTTRLNVSKDISIQAHFANTTPNSAALNSVTETFTFGDTSVPEPGSFVMTGLAALLFAAYSWRKRLCALFAL
jgi:hypothetical protein